MANKKENKKKSKTKIDEKSRKILKLLQENGRESIRKISNQLNLKPTSVFNRIKKLEESIINKYTILINKEALNYNVIAFVFISYKSGKENQEQLAEQLSKYQEITDVSIITGEWDLLIKIVEKNVKSLGNFITKILRNKEGIEKTNTIIVLNEVKSNGNLPL